MSLLSLQTVSKAYGEVQALQDVSLTLTAGSRTAVVGASGSGKSTLLRLVAGFGVPDSGRIALNGQIIADGAAAVPAHRRGIGFVSQDGALFPHLSVAENIGFGLDRGAAGREARILALMDMVELARPMLSRRPHELSGGQQQRVALARALARQPRLMLLDEPFSALDAGLRDKLRRTIARVLRDASITVLLVTHDQAEALSFADQLAVLREGRLVQAGPPRELYLRPADRDIAAFLGEAVLLPAELEAGAVRCRLGRIAAATHGGPRAVEVMLRPEQLELSAAGPAERDPDAVYGSIIEAEFGGSVWSLAVALEAEDAAAAPVPPLLVRSTGFAMPHPGQRVRITVTGDAHVLGQANFSSFTDA